MYLTRPSNAFIAASFSHGMPDPDLMRFAIITSGYPQFLDWLYEVANPGLAGRSFAEQQEAYYASLFATSDFYSHALKGLGHEVEEFIFNCDPMQLAWRQENLVASVASGRQRPENKDASSSISSGDFQQHLLTRLTAFKTAIARTSFRLWLAPLGRPLLARVHQVTTYGFPLLVEQVRRARPDVLLIQTIYSFNNEQLRELKKHVSVLVGEQAVMPIAEHIDYRNYDLIVSSFPPLVDWMRNHGVRAEANRLAFDPRVDRMIPQMPRDLPLSFVGSIFPMHSSRLKLLEAVAAKIPSIEAHGNITIDVTANSPLRERIYPALWGREMYRLLRRSQITINHHGDVLPYANNMRMYEATGMGTLLVTDHKDNLAEMFEPEREVVTYRDASECVDKVRFYLEPRNESKRKAIAAAGYERTLREHTYAQRISRLVALIEGRQTFPQ